MRDMKMGGEENGVDGVVTGMGGEEDEKERTIAKAALSIAELGQYLILHIHAFPLLTDCTFTLRIVALLDGPSITTDTSETTADTQPTNPPDGEGDLEKEDPTTITRDTTYIPLRSVNAVAAHIPFIEDAREKVTAEMQTMVLTGLSTLVRLLALCLSPSLPFLPMQILFYNGF